MHTYIHTHIYIYIYIYIHLIYVHKCLKRLLQGFLYSFIFIGACRRLWGVTLTVSCLEGSGLGLRV